MHSYYSLKKRKKKNLIAHSSRNNKCPIDTWLNWLCINLKNCFNFHEAYGQIFKGIEHLKHFITYRKREK